MTKNRSRILYVKRFLEEQTDEAHPAAITDIIAHLADRGIPANRKTVAQDIDQLIESGEDVVCNKGRQNQYFIGERHFEAPELKLLIDAAQASKFLTAKRSKAVIGKLLALTSGYQAERLTSGLYFDKQPKPQNENAYLAADIMFAAIGAGKRVRFMYYEYGPDKKKTYKHNRQIYEFSPWSFIWNNDSYYIIGYSENHGKAVTFRVDRIAAPKLIDEDSVPAPEGFNLASFVQSVFHMYDGPMLEVTVKCRNELMKTAIDRFGEDVHTEIADAGHFYATAGVFASAAFYGWVFGLDGAIEIVSPAEAVDAYRAMLERAKSFVALKP